MKTCEEVKKETDYLVCNAGIWYTREPEQAIKELEAEYAITDVVQGKFFTPTKNKHRVLYVWKRDSGETQLTVNLLKKMEGDERNG